MNATITRWQVKPPWGPTEATTEILGKKKLTRLQSDAHKRRALNFWG